MEVFIFISVLSLFLGVGYIASHYNTGTPSDYLLASKTISPLLTALSAASSKYSGYMFIGLVGYIYLNGLSAVWILFGFLFGDFLVFYSIHKKVNQETHRLNAISFLELISRWHHGDYALLRIVIGVISLIFMLVYAAAQFNAGGKALYVIFGWNYSLSAIICSVLILAYCLKGGLRASIWTDAVQSLVMMLSLAILFFSIIAHTDGLLPLINQLENISPDYMDLGLQKFGSLQATTLFAIGWIFNGIGVTGQPHIMVRFMALDSPNNINKTGYYYFIWSTLFLFLILFISLSARLFIDPATLIDNELALPTLAQLLLPSIGVGLLLSSIFSSIISTTDSQILSCSAIISNDFKLGKTHQKKYYITFLVTITALLISLFSSANVFTLVIFAWSALACTMGPLVIIQAWGQRPPQWLALTMVIAGLSTALVWRMLGLSADIYEAAPGIIASIAVFFIASLFTKLGFTKKVR
jgi:Na+/proline symporter